MSIRSLRSTYAILATVLVATALAAPRLAAQEPERPVLTAGGDPKLWEPYFDQGVKLFSHGPVSAERNFYWASKLDPTRAEPLYARYAAILARSKETDIIGYFRHDAVTWRRPEIIAADSLRMLAFMRSPFVHRGLEALIFERFPGAYPDDLDTRAWIAYSNGDFQKAIELQTRRIERGGRAARWRRVNRAISYVSLGDNRRALDDLRTLLESLRVDDDATATTFYESKHFLLYMIGMLHTTMRDYVSARAAFQESLLENAAFAYGNSGLAALSRIQRNNAQAADEYALAIELAPYDGVLRHWRATVLFDLQRYADAEQELTRAIAIEPHWPAPVHLLARVRERQGRENDALDLYAKYVAMASVNDAAAKALKPRLAARAPRTP